MSPTALAEAAAIGVLPEPEAPIRPSVLAHRASPIEHSTDISATSGLAGLIAKSMNSPALTNAVPATPVVTIGTRIRAEVLRDVATIVRFPSSSHCDRTVGDSAKSD
jgi:hypothetical protein